MRINGKPEKSNFLPGSFHLVFLAASLLTRKQQINVEAEGRGGGERWRNQRDGSFPNRRKKEMKEK